MRGGEALLQRLAAWRRPLSLIGVALGLLLFLQQLWISLGAIRRYGVSSVGRPAWLIAALLLGLLVFPAVMAAWMLIMRHLAVRLSLAQTFEGFQFSALARYIPGSVWGYLSRSQWLERAYGVRYLTSLHGSVLEAVEQGLTALAVGLACFSLSLGENARWVLAAGSVGLVACTWLLAPPVVAAAWQRLFKSDPVLGGSRRAWGGAIGTQTVQWLIYGASVLCLCRALTPTSGIVWWQATAASSLAWFIGFVIVFVPSGIGIREGMLAAMLAWFGGLSPADASLIAVASRLGLLLAELAWLGVGMALYARRWRRESVAR